ncbi:MAG TPA: HtaA domain-containing protein [Baekduia sp.]
MIPRLIVCAVAAGCALPATASAAASASATAGSSTLTFNKVLSAQGVKVSAVAPARTSGAKLVLPVKAVTVAGAATLTHSGAIRLRKGRRSVTLTAPIVELARAGRLRAQVGGTSFAILTVDARAHRLDATLGTAALRAGTVRLTAAGAAVIRTALRLKRLAPAAIGTLTVSARRGAVPSTGAATGTSGPGPGATGGPTGGGTTTTPGGGTTTTPGGGSATPTCPTATAAGGPAALARPATAVELTGATITWHVRDSFIQYINAGQGTAACNGATADAPTIRPGSSTPLAYDFHFPFTDGWYDPVSQTARVTFTGTVSFRYSGHGIDLAAVNPEIELAGTASRVIFATANTGQAPARGVLETLDLAGAASIAHQPPTHTYTAIPGAIPTDAGSSTFAGYYQAGDPFGWVTVQLSTP